MFENSTILITGGTGSFGKAALNRFLLTKPKQIRIFSRDEKKQEDLRLELKNDNIKFFVGDVRDNDSITYAMKDVNYVFHAAALKQVPSCEFFPMEAIKTNVNGTNNVLNAASQAKVKKLIVLSTDKAVYPINAMGLSKAIAEKVMISQARQQKENETIFCATRYGNVMASRGSVIPLFASQIKRNLPITVTDPKMTRFLMSLENSVDLVLHAFTEGKQGDIFIQKSPACTLSDLAEALKKIFNSKSEIRIIGSRHGEKIHETLLTREEINRAENIGNYYRIPCDNRLLNYSKFFDQGVPDLAEMEDYNSSNTKRLNIDETIKTLLDLDFIKSELNA